MSISSKKKKIIIQRNSTGEYQDKTITPSKETQEVYADLEYDALRKVIVEAIPAEYAIPSGSLDITENGNYDVKDKESVSVNVGTIPDGYIIPSGSLTITKNGTYDVTKKASAVVNVNMVTEGTLVSGTLTVSTNSSNLSLGTSYPYSITANIGKGWTNVTTSETEYNSSPTVTYDSSTGVATVSGSIGTGNQKVTVTISFR